MEEYIEWFSHGILRNILLMSVPPAQRRAYGQLDTLLRYGKKKNKKKKTANMLGLCEGKSVARELICTEMFFLLVAFVCFLFSREFIAVLTMMVSFPKCIYTGGSS